MKNNYNNVNFNNYNRALTVNSKLFSDQDGFDSLLMIRKDDILNDMFNQNEDNAIKTYITKKPAPCIDNDNEESLSDLTITLSKFELAKDNNVTIMQSRDVSVIPDIKKKTTLIKQEPNINLDKLLDLTSTGNDFYPIKEDKKEKITLSNSPSVNGNMNKLNIKVPNPRRSEGSNMRRQEKLILLDEKEKSIEIKKVN